MTRSMNWVSMGIGEIKWSKLRGGDSSWYQMTLGGKNVILLLLNMGCSKMAWGPQRQFTSIIRPWVQFLGPLVQLWSPLAIWAWLGPDKLRDQSGIKLAAESMVDAGLRDKRDKNRKGGRGSGKEDTMPEDTAHYLPFSADYALQPSHLELFLPLILYLFPSLVHRISFILTILRMFHFSMALNTFFI